MASNLLQCVKSTANFGSLATVLGPAKFGGLATIGGVPQCATATGTEAAFLIARAEAKQFLLLISDLGFCTGKSSTGKPQGTGAFRKETFVDVLIERCRE